MVVRSLCLFGYDLLFGLVAYVFLGCYFDVMWFVITVMFARVWLFVVVDLVCYGCCLIVCLLFYNSC